MISTYPDATITRKPDRGIRSTPTFQSAGFTSQAGYNKSRLISRRGLEAYDIIYTNILGTLKSSIRTFFDERNGGHESFIFDKAHINESGLITVKFVENSFREVRVRQADTEAASIYTVSFKIKQTYS